MCDIRIGNKPEVCETDVYLSIQNNGLLHYGTSLSTYTETQGMFQPLEHTLLSWPTRVRPRWIKLIKSMATQLLAFAKLVIWLLWKPLGQSVLIMIIGFLVMYMFIDSYRTNCIKNAVECSCIVVYYQKSSLQNIVFVVALTLSCLRIAIQYHPLSGVAFSSRNPDTQVQSGDLCLA